MSFDVGRDPFAAHCSVCDALATTGNADGRLYCDDCHADAVARGDVDE